LLLNVLELDTPALLIDLDVMESNIRRMADYFNTKKAKLRPHVKTHKTPIIAQKQLDAGAIGITCAKLGEAEVMNQWRIEGILLANEIVGSLKISRLVSLAKYSRIIVAVDRKENASDISKAAEQKGLAIDVVVEIDVGLNRCGVLPDEACELVGAIRSMSGLRFRGLMGYEGHCVFISNRDERRRMTEESLSKLMFAKDIVEKSGQNVEIVSAGGTGTYDITGEYPGVTEIQAGSYVLMDGRYKALNLGFDCALSLLTTVMSKRGNRIVVDAGTKTCSTEKGLPTVLDVPGATVLKLNEEHGIIELPQDSHISVGDKMQLIPMHGDTTINIHDHYYGIRKGELETVWRIEARGKST